MLKRFLMVLTALVLICFQCAAMADEARNLLYNGDFETIDQDGLPSGWLPDAYYQQEGYTLFSLEEEGPEHGHCAAIQNLAENDARFAQTVAVEPETLYCLSGWVRCDQVEEDDGRGANLSISGLYAFSNSVYDTDGEWRHIEYYGETGEDQHELTVFVRLGGYGGESRGKAVFDDIRLVEVDAVPGKGIADLWFTLPSGSSQDTALENDTEGMPFWPWLLGLSLLYMAAIGCAVPVMAREKHDLSRREKTPAALWIGLALAELIRVVIGLKVQGYQVDVGCFTSWGATMAQFGAQDFYQATSFCDYPPAYVYVLGLCSRLAELLKGVPEAFIYKLIPMTCDLAAAGLIYRLAVRRDMDRSAAAAIALVAALNPAVIINSAAWCQMDAVLCLGLMLVALWAIERKWIAVMAAYMVCVLIKPQALMLGPLGLTAIIQSWLREKQDRRSMLIGCGAALAAALVILIPFSLHQEWDWLIQLYSRTLMSYPYATVNTANYYYLFNANWKPIEASAPALASLIPALLCWAAAGFTYVRRQGKKLGLFEPAVMAAAGAFFLVMTFLKCSWAVLGTAMMVLAFLVTLPMYVRGGKTEHLPLVGSVLFLLLYVFGVKMHERYLFPAVFLLGMAFVICRDWRILLLMAVSSMTVFINEGIVLDNSIRLGSAMGHLNMDTQGLAMALSAVNVALAVLAVWTAWSVVVEGSVLAVRKCGIRDVKDREDGAARKKNGPDPLHYVPDGGLHWTRKDTVIVLCVTLIYSVVALWNLGSTKAPQTVWRSSSYDEEVVIDLGREYDAFYMLYYGQVSYHDFHMTTSVDNVNWSEEHSLQMAEGQCYRWKYACYYQENDGQYNYFTANPYEFSGRYVTISADQIGLALCEVIFRDAEGNTIPARVIEQRGQEEASPLNSDANALLDEQDTLDGEPGWYNSTYFDEIYYARTGYELLHGTVPYETTHPPMGKLVMALCIAIFGMTPFGWRFGGTFAGILMLPVMYLLGKQMTKKSGMAFAAMCMMALDCMHLTQTRICTIDSFPVLFILLAFFFMLRFMQKDIVRDSLKSLLPELAASGLFMGCAIASKWIGMYAGAGLAVLFFWTCLRHLIMAGRAGQLLRNSGKELSAEEKALLECRAKRTLRRILILCAWCVLFFVAIPAVVYILCYIPYFAYTKVTGPVDLIQRIIRAQIGMFNYHSTPGLGMDHPFYSPWYEWPLIKRPMYYAMSEFMPAGYNCAIFSFGNPAVWYTGLVGLAVVLFNWGRRHFGRRAGSDSLVHLFSCTEDVTPAFILVGLAAEFLPWVIVPRGTYIYHYFASIPFLCLSIMMALFYLTRRFPRAGRWVTGIYLAVCLVCFIGFYPYASGMVTPVAWLDFMKQFLHLYY